MSSEVLLNVHRVDVNTTKRAVLGGVRAVTDWFRGAENTPGMQRPSVYPYTINEPPGINVHRLRQTYGWSMRELADKCHPPLDHTTVRRLENNKGFTQDTIERIAKALKVPRWQDLFLPLELADWPHLPERTRARLAESVQDAAARYHTQKTG